MQQFSGMFAASNTWPASAVEDFVLVAIDEGDDEDAGGVYIRTRLVLMVRGADICGCLFEVLEFLGVEVAGCVVAAENKVADGNCFHLSHG